MWQETLEDWNFQISGRDKTLEITSLTDGTRIQIQMIGHYGIVLETQKMHNVLYLEDALGDKFVVLFLEDREKELCSFKAVRQVHEVNHHKQKDELIAAYRNTGWMSPELWNIIHRVVNDCKVCQKFTKLVTRPKIPLPKSQSFNEVVTLYLKEFGTKYILWMIYSFTQFMQGKLITNKKADMIINALTDSGCMSVGFPSQGFFHQQWWRICQHKIRWVNKQTLTHSQVWTIIFTMVKWLEWTELCQCGHYNKEADGRTQSISNWFISQSSSRDPQYFSEQMG